MLNDFISIFTSLNIWVAICMFGFMILAIIEIFKPKFGIFGLISAAFLLAGVLVHVFVVNRPMQLFFIMLLFGGVVSIVFAIKHIISHFKWYKKNPRIKDETLSPLNFGRAIAGEDLSYLLDMKGIAKTEIKPTGKAMFKEELFEVASQGEFIEQGATVRVIKIEGSRIIVKAYKGAL